MKCPDICWGQEMILLLIRQLVDSWLDSWPVLDSSAVDESWDFLDQSSSVFCDEEWILLG